MSLHKEVEFENDIFNHLSRNGWLFDDLDAEKYDRSLAFFPPDLIEWIKITQPNQWQTLEKKYGANIETVIFERLRKQIDDRGTLEVLRHGIEIIGSTGKLSLAQFKPALSMNADLQSKYSANRLRVIRQVRYSLHNENSIDLVLFLNGIPIATVELKSDFTQSVKDAVDQYRFDRNPKIKGQASETLLDFPRGAIVHFAVSNSEVMMTTKLQGKETVFLPFNKGNNGAAGNPLNSKGNKTSYLWEEVWARESWLEIIGRYLITKNDSKKRIMNIIFPRYHQLDATRKLTAAVLKNGAGGKYLIQHSAGSGKTNSIAWTAHFLADLHDKNSNKIFDSIIVVSDRNVIDDQLQEAIDSFQRTQGVVATIKGDGQSKSQELTEALSSGKKIIVCTIQTFPFALRAVQEQASADGKHFAVIADEAHSSQSGEAASKLKQLLTTDELKELSDGGEVSTEDLLLSQMGARANDEGITYIAFTATPKAKTLELFGTKPNPDAAASNENLPAPFHLYSMRQAIEEGFILDVLRNYTSYKLAFRLASGGDEFNDTEVERKEALKGIMRWIRLNSYNIDQKVAVVVEHFIANVSPLLDGQAKAMVVTGSRLEAVKWQIAIKKYIKGRYKIDTLVAFSGEIKEGSDSLTETSTKLNPGLKGRDIRDAFKTNEFQILLVANKFQTGFDQPLLCGMYIDKSLGGIQAVQTLSRLNRSHPGKDTTYILDFMDQAPAVLSAFKTYYETAELDSATDPNLIFDIRAELDGSGHYDDDEIEKVVLAELNPQGTQSDLSAAIAPTAQRLLDQYKAHKVNLKSAKDKNDSTREREIQDEIDSLILFKRNLTSFLRAYSFLSQIFDYGNTDIEKRSIFYKRLIPLLEFGRERKAVDLSKIVLTHHRLRNDGQRNLNLNEGEAPRLQPLTDTGADSIPDPERASIMEIIEGVNDLFEGELTDDDKLVYVNKVLKGKLLESTVLIEQAASNTKEQFANSPDLSKELLNAIMDALSAHSTMSRQALNSEKVKDGLKDILLGPANLYEALRSKGINSSAKK
jgi:type I restriction enzyme R subunit